MKRYLQAGVIAFFLFASIALTRQSNTQPTPTGATVGTTNMNATLLIGTASLAQSGAGIDDDAPQGLTISSALVKTSLGNRVLYELNSGQHWPLASLTKLMNAVVALENIPQSAERDSFVKRMMVLSDNDSADALAKTLGTEQYIALMNAKAQTLNMRQTGFSDVSGLSYLNQSTVEDIDKLVTYILIRHPEIFAFSREKTIRIGTADRPNINEFAGRADFMGGKTGWTDEANGNLVTIFSTASGPITIIILGSRAREDRFIETNTLFEWTTRHFKL
ncbi:MAG: D-alanyl-D-alanine carboxypeptidase [Candidatus Pacebacteria bacterium]|nr:D-alanyl-D-alanine carboxypeptidase [Candidatus Paceibacterota bacterium]